MLALVVYVLFVTPYELAFVARVPDGSGLHLMNWFVDLCFWMDLVLEFSTGYYDSDRGRWVTDRRTIASNYCSGWFWPDITSLLPW